MFRAFFAARRGRENQLIVTLGSVLRENPEWELLIYYDDPAVVERLRGFVAGRASFRRVKVSNVLYALEDLLKRGDRGRGLFISDNILFNKSHRGLAESPIDGYDIVIRPDRPLELIPAYNEIYGRRDHYHSAKLRYSRSYFTCGLVGFNLDRIRQNLPWQNLVSDFEANAERYGGYKDYLNEFFAPAVKGLIPGLVAAKPEVFIEKFIAYGMCIRHNVRLQKAASINFIGPIQPWSEDDGPIGRIHLQIPFRHYLNVALRYANHLDPEFLDAVMRNARRWSTRFGTLDKAFAAAYPVEPLP